jgi:hypothetical protein
VEFALGVKPGLSHILALELLMDQYFANTVLKPPIRLNRQFTQVGMCPSLDSLRNMPKWVSKRDGALLKLPNALHNASAPQPGKAASVRQPVGHTFAQIIQKGVI